MDVLFNLGRERIDSLAGKLEWGKNWCGLPNWGSIILDIYRFYIEYWIYGFTSMLFVKEFTLLLEKKNIRVTIAIIRRLAVLWTLHSAGAMTLFNHHFLKKKNTTRQSLNFIILILITIWNKNLKNLTLSSDKIIQSFCKFSSAHSLKCTSFQFCDISFGHAK